jgi:hypothetical protein
LRFSYTRSGTPSRDPRCVFAVHGMNTDGAWEHEFGWQVEVAYGYAIPFWPVKYGWACVSPFLGPMQNALRNWLVGQFRERLARRPQRATAGAPDVIAHSFGTWLIAYALLADPDLHLGRIILVGSIVPPDFDWASLIQAGRVNAVLCHTAGHDIWARLAAWGFPRTGPSGAIGFNDRQAVIHRHDPGFYHGTAFEKSHLADVFGRVWAPFLEASTPGPDHPPGLGTPTHAAWHSSRLRVWPGRLTLVAALLATLCVVGRTLRCGLGLNR